MQETEKKNLNLKINEREIVKKRNKIQFNLFYFRMLAQVKISNVTCYVNKM